VGPEGHRPAFAEASQPWRVERGHPNEYRNLRKAVMGVRYPWKLILTPYLDRIELYDLDRDPEERNDVSRENPEKVEELRRMIEGWRTNARSSPAKPDEENLRRLESLGYVEGAPDSP
jgi:hypothetical protein